MPTRTIGLIAGASQFPLLFARTARAQGWRVVAVAHEGETLPELASEVDEITWVHLGQLGKLIKALKKGGASQAVMCGGVAKTRMFKDVKPDLKALALVDKLRHMADDGILRTLAGALADAGITILPSHELVPELLAAPGQYTGRWPSEDELVSAKVGWKLAGELGRLDIGQAVVLKSRAVVAVEAIEGTDACIRRGGELAGGGAVVVKRCKPSQDRRFDLPSVGAGTIAAMAQAGCAVLIIEAGSTLVFDRVDMIRRAEEADISVAAWTEGKAVS